MLPSRTLTLVHLVDGTYELFRKFHGRRRGGSDGKALGAVFGVQHSLLQTVETGSTWQRG